MGENFKCPVCGELIKGEPRMNDICPRCGWEDDDYQFYNQNLSGGANKMSLNQAREAWANGEEVY